MEKLCKRLLTAVLCLALVVSFAMPAAAASAGADPSDTDIVIPLEVPGAMAGDTQRYCTSVSMAAAKLRQGLKNRTESITFGLRTSRSDEALLEEIYDLAVSHTGVPTEGDYLRWQISGYQVDAKVYFIGSYYYTLTYTPAYYTTAAQETEMDEAVDTLLTQLDVDDAGDYEKICAIYDYICENVTYGDPDSTLDHTAYAALVNGTAVCQGYANLFYRLALELDVDARLIAGTCDEGDHGWNIIKLGGKYYNVDATWDAVYAQADQDYAYFLKCDADYVNHVRAAEYLTTDFQTKYPMATRSYGDAIPGDIDGDGDVDTDDVVQLLLYVSMPDVFTIDAEADFTGEGEVNTDDVVRLLLYVSMPDVFPLAA